jgi:hypothetical protein
MSGLLMVYGFPSSQAPGTEGLGKNVDTTTLTTVAPNGIVETPVALQNQIALVATQGQQLVFPWWRPSLNVSPNI